MREGDFAGVSRSLSFLIPRAGNDQSISFPPVEGAHYYSQEFILLRIPAGTGSLEINFADGVHYMFDGFFSSWLV
jgi:hypothetical protein